MNAYTTTSSIIVTYKFNNTAYELDWEVRIKLTSLWVKSHEVQHRLESVVQKRQTFSLRYELLCPSPANNSVRTYRMSSEQAMVCKNQLQVLETCGMQAVTQISCMDLHACTASAWCSVYIQSCMWPLDLSVYMQSWMMCILGSILTEPI